MTFTLKLMLTQMHFHKLLKTLFLSLTFCIFAIFNINSALATSPLNPKPSLSSLSFNKNSSPVYIRIFKKESRLEIWHKTGLKGYTLHKSYKICKWSGQLGPKQLEGDKQSPEGFYTLTSGQLGWYTRKWRESFNIGFPNRYDLAQKRSGTNLLIHGGCSSVGCYAMTNKAMHEIYNFIASKVEHGQQIVPLHIFPFRMTKANLQRHIKSPWYSFWQSLKPAYDLFEASRTPPKIQVCNGRYKVISQKKRKFSLSMLERINRRLQYRLTSFTPKDTTQKTQLSQKCQSVQAKWVAKRQARHPAPRRGNSFYLPAKDEQAYGGKQPYPRLNRRSRRFVIRCNIKRPSCKRWVFLKRKRLKKIYARNRHKSKRSRTRSARRLNRARNRAKYRRKNRKRRRYVRRRR